MNSKKKIFLSLTIFLIVLLMGVVGFKILGGKDWSLLDSLYMTVITLSTVGYEEPLDISNNQAARIFAIVFIILCLGTIAFAVSSITSFIVEGELKNILGRKRMEKQIAKLKDHYIVCGIDGVAYTIIKELQLTRKKFVVIESAKEKIDRLSSSEDILFIHGDPTEDDVLISAGIKRAKGILPSLPSDEENLFITITSRSLNPSVRIVTKGIDLKSHKKMVKAGADAVVSPTFIGGMRMVSEMIRPAVVTFLDMMLRDRDEILRFEEVKVGKGAPLLGKTIEESKLEDKTGALLVAVKEEGRDDYNFNPPKERAIKENDILVLIASPDRVEEIERMISGT